MLERVHILRCLSLVSSAVSSRKHRSEPCCRRNAVALSLVLASRAHTHIGSAYAARCTEVSHSDEELTLLHALHVHA